MICTMNESHISKIITKSNKCFLTEPLQVMYFPAIACLFHFYWRPSWFLYWPWSRLVFLSRGLLWTWVLPKPKIPTRSALLPLIWLPTMLKTLPLLPFLFFRPLTFLELISGDLELLFLFWWSIFTSEISSETSCLGWPVGVRTRRSVGIFFTFRQCLGNSSFWGSI